MMSLSLNLLEDLEIKKNRCYSLVISEKDLTEIALNALKTHIKERLEGYEFLTINQVLQRALAQES